MVAVLLSILLQSVSLTPDPCYSAAEAVDLNAHREIGDGVSIYVATDAQNTVEPVIILDEFEEHIPEIALSEIQEARIVVTERCQ